MMSTAIRQSARLVQGSMSLIFPYRCCLCDAPVTENTALCADCFAAVEFLGGLTCCLCGAPLPGESTSDEKCDDCLSLARPWSEGAAVISYSDAGRRFVLKLKHADRPELARIASKWMVQSAESILADKTLVPVPAHWSRRVARRYNQSAELCRWVSKRTGLDYLPLALKRTRATPGQDHKTQAERFENLEGAIIAKDDALKGRDVCLIDDVMTSGATLSASARAALEAGARDVSVLVVARVVKQT